MSVRVQLEEGSRGENTNVRRANGLLRDASFLGVPARHGTDGSRSRNGLFTRHYTSLCDGEHADVDATVGLLCRSRCRLQMLCDGCKKTKKRSDNVMIGGILGDPRRQLSPRPGRRTVIKSLVGDLKP